MKGFILIAILMTQQDYKRGFGDGIAASKSASAAMQIIKFTNKKECIKVRDHFLNMITKNKETILKAECIQYQE